MKINDELLSVAQGMTGVPDSQDDKDALAYIVKTFKNMPFAERSKLGETLSRISTILKQDAPFKPQLFEQGIKVKVASNLQLKALQNALFKMGCGFHNGSYPLSQHILDEKKLADINPTKVIGIHVSRTGALGLTFESDADWFELSGGQLVSAGTVLSAKNLSALNKSIHAESHEKTTPADPMWEFASKLVEKHGMDGDDTMTDEEHAEWQKVSGQAHAKLPKGALKGLTPESKFAANTEGWNVFVRGDGDVELCRIDSPEDWAEDQGIPSVAKLADDESAWVIALTGTQKHHLEAQALMERLNQKEFKEMQKFVQEHLRDKTDVVFCSVTEDYVDIDVYVEQTNGSEFLQRFYVNRSATQELIRDEVRYSEGKGSDFDDGGIVPVPDYVSAAFNLAVPRAMKLIQSTVDSIEDRVRKNAPRG